MITSREAKRIALMNIVEAGRADVAHGGSAYWSQHPEKGHDLAEEDMKEIALAAEQVFIVLERRAGRLRSFGER